jgi:protein ImuA
MSNDLKPALPEADSRTHLMQQLQRQLGYAGTTAQDCVTLAAHLEVFSSGLPALDRLLPGGGLRHGMLVEWLGEPRGNGAATLSLLAGREACCEGGVLVVIDREQTFYPPAAAAWGIDLARLIVVHPRTARDALWAAVQSLRSPVVAAMWTAVDRLDSREFRRLQLAAQSGRTLGLLMRPVRVRGQPSWADVQIVVGRSRIESPGSSARAAALDLRSLTLRRRVHVHITRTRGARPGGHVIFEIDDAAHTVHEAISTHDTHPLPVVTELADPATAAVSARA